MATTALQLNGSRIVRHVSLWDCDRLALKVSAAELGSLTIFLILSDAAVLHMQLKYTLMDSDISMMQLYCTSRSLHIQIKIILNIDIVSMVQLYCIFSWSIPWWTVIYQWCSCTAHLAEVYLDGQWYMNDAAVQHIQIKLRMMNTDIVWVVHSCNAHPAEVYLAKLWYCAIQSDATVL